MLTPYKDIIEKINININVFNRYLKEEFRINAINCNHAEKITHGNWNGFKFPSPEKSGVYFIFGYNGTTSQSGVYIGKASFSNKIGHRLFQHLSKCRNDKNFKMRKKDGNEYVLEYLSSIDMESCQLSCFASSLEEFLIQNANCELINDIGARK